MFYAKWGDEIEPENWRQSSARFLLFLEVS